MFIESDSFVTSVSMFFINLFLWIGIIGLVLILAYLFLQWFKHRKREVYSLDFVTLLVRLPKDNEVKIDAAEQMFAGLYSLKNDGIFSFLKPEEIISFEIVGLKEEIAFYVSCPRKIRDLVEKQIHEHIPLLISKKLMR